MMTSTQMMNSDWYSSSAQSSCHLHHVAVICEAQPLGEMPHWEVPDDLTLEIWKKNITAIKSFFHDEGEVAGDNSSGLFY